MLEDQVAVLQPAEAAHRVAEIALPASIMTMIGCRWRMSPADWYHVPSPFLYRHR
ncbi:hypothetical protein ACFFP0_29240 [Rhizobium puerariae]|uniref:Uncharacterized protein n=1 Tax=Rhizobium puerariae TaxID=1585791 RepID=A0ABV6AQZ2_9HYPH